LKRWKRSDAILHRVEPTNRELLIWLQQNCDPTVPATEAERVETEAARGVRPLLDLVRNELETKKPGSRMQMPFAGHIGSGKSTELRHVILKLGAELVGQFAFVYVDTDQFLETLDVESEDLYLGLVQVLAQEAKRLGISIRQSYLQERLTEVGEILGADVEPGEVKATAGWITTTFRLQSTTREHRNKIRARLRGKDESLQKHVNDLISEFRVKLSAHLKAPDLQTVIVFDGCERIEGYRNKERGAQSFHQLFIEESNVFTGLDSHLILTMPIAHARACADQIRARYAGTLQSMPSIKVTERDGKTPYEAGYRVFRKIVDHRLPEGSTQDRFFEPKALDFLIRYSGGYPRGFLNALEEACRNARLDGDVLPIGLDAARDAFDGFVRNSAAAISRIQWRRLAELEVDKNIDSDDPVIQALLRENLIFEYINGAQSSGFGKPKPWYAVHPVIRELEDLAHTMAEVEKERAAAEKDGVDPA
jgi:hypothetical protein